MYWLLSKKISPASWKSSHAWTHSCWLAFGGAGLLHLVDQQAELVADQRVHQAFGPGQGEDLPQMGIEQRIVPYVCRIFSGGGQAGFCGRRDRGKRDERPPDAQEAEQFTAVHVIQLTRQVRLGHDTAREGRCYVEGVRDHIRFGFQQGVQFICCDLQDPAELRADERVGVCFPAFPPAHCGAVDAELVGKDFLAVAEGLPPFRKASP